MEAHQISLAFMRKEYSRGIGPENIWRLLSSLSQEEKNAILHELMLLPETIKKQVEEAKKNSKKFYMLVLPPYKKEEGLFIGAIKELRAHSELGLKDAKDVLESYTVQRVHLKDTLYDTELSSSKAASIIHNFGAQGWQGVSLEEVSFPTVKSN